MIYSNHSPMQDCSPAKRIDQGVYYCKGHRGVIYGGLLQLSSQFIINLIYVKKNYGRQIFFLMKSSVQSSAHRLCGLC